MGQKRDEHWEQRCLDLVEFINKNMRMPSLSSNDTNEKSLRQWLLNNKAAYRTGTLEEYRENSLYEIIPQTFGGNAEDSLLNKLLRKSNIDKLANDSPSKESKSTKLISDVTLGKLIALGIDSTDKLVQLIQKKLDNPNQTNKLVDKVMAELKLGIFNSGVVYSKIKNVENEVLASKLNNLIYDADVGTLKLYSAVICDSVYKHINDIYYCKKYIHFMLKTLTEREKLVLVERYYNNCKLEHIGAKLGVIKERARQIEGKSLRKLRAPKRRSVLNGQGLHEMFSTVASREELKRVLVAKEHSDKVAKVEDIANDIRRYSNLAYKTQFILGAEYVGVLGSGKNLSKIEQIIKDILNKDAKYRQAYIDIFEQGVGLGQEVSKELTENFIKEITKRMQVEI